MAAATANQKESDFTAAGYNGRPEPLRTLFFNRGEAMEMHLAVSPDNMRVFLKIVPGPDCAPITADMISDLLRAAGVVEGIKRPGIEFFAALQNSPERFDGFFQVAAGEPMRKGEDGSIEFHVQPSAAAARYDQTDSGGIDFKQLNLLENCFEGQRVATVIPPSPGKPGYDVFGGAIPAQPGAPARVVPGPGVIMGANGRDFTSEVEGRLIHDGDVLSVSPVLEILQDVDYGVGNIDFVGKVVVNGSLLDGFNVRGKRGVEIKGDVGAASIFSEGDVEILGGVQGKDVAKIECAGLKARYIDNATVEATGDVVADKEIFHSTVKSLGRVTIAQGAIMGGETWGLRGVEAESIGSELGVATTVAAGLSWTDENIIADVRVRIAEGAERARTAHMLLDPLLSASNSSVRLTLDQKSMISDLIGELRTLRDFLAGLNEEKNAIMNRSRAGSVCQINVLKRLCMGTNIRFPEAAGTVKDEIKGPLSVVQDEDRKIFRITASSSLPPAPGVSAPAGGGTGSGNKSGES